jgi:serine protease Do
VVNVAVTSRGANEEMGQRNGMMQNLPPGLQQFFGPMTPQRPEHQIEHGVGSGIIISRSR